MIEDIKKGKAELLRPLSDGSYLINSLDRNISEGKFQDLKQHGVGQTTILKFLGGGVIFF